MHRLIMLSETYQQGGGEPTPRSRSGESSSAGSPRRRLDAEAIRDAMLCVGGNLDRTPGGPHPFPPVENWDFTQHNPFCAVYDTNRRSVYLMTQRLEAASVSGPVRRPRHQRPTPPTAATTVPTQALFFMNDPVRPRAGRGARAPG